MNDIIQDVVFAWRNALKKPATAFLIVITLALGIGANTAIFSMTYHALLAPLPYAEASRLVKLEQHTSDRENYGWSVPTLTDIRAQNTVFSDLITYLQQPFTLVTQDKPHQVQAGIVDGDFFTALGIQAQHGRVFTGSDNEAGAVPVILLSHGFWTRAFAGDFSIVGSTVEIQHIVYQVIGVLPEIPPYPHSNDVWIPNVSDPYQLLLFDDSFALNRRGEYTTHVLGILQNEIPFTAAANELVTIADRLVTSYPDVYVKGYAITLQSLQEEIAGNSTRTFLLLQGLALLIVLIASANVASLNLARTMARTQELAIREAVGASPARIFRQLLTEGLLYSLAGGLLGLVVAWGSLNLLKNFAAGYTALASEIAMDGAVVLFTLGVALLTGILSVFAAAHRRRDINKALKEGGDKVTAASSDMRRRQTLLLAQFACSFFILTVSALILLSLYRLQDQQDGYGQEQILELSMTLELDLVDPQQERFAQAEKDFAQRFLAEAVSIPGVEMAGVRAGFPLLQEPHFSANNQFDIESHPVADPAERPVFTINFVSEDYFSVMNIPVQQGRMFVRTDDDNGLPVAIVNESFAARYFPAGDVVGQRLKLGMEQSWRTIVGVAADIRSRDLDESEGTVVYYSFWQFPAEIMNFYVKSSLNPQELENTLENLVHSINPQQSIGSVRSLQEIKSRWLAPVRLRATLIGLFGTLALTVTLSGVIGVVSYSISQRVREIGILMAIGATPSNITGMFIIGGLKVYLAGLLVGVALLLAAAPALEPLLYQTSATDAGVYLLSAVSLTLVVLLALLIPSSRASAMSPIRALNG